MHPSTIYRVIRLLSLDIVFGVLSGALYFTSILGINMPWQYWVILPGTVWMIYTSDHILDQIKLQKQSSVQQQRFHSSNKMILIAVLMVLCIIICLLLPALSLKVILSGVMLFLLVIFYLYLVHVKQVNGLPKALAISTMYVAGILIGPVFHANNIEQPFILGIIILVYVLIVLINVLIINHMNTIFPLLGKTFGKSLIPFCLSIALILSVTAGFFVEFKNLAPLIVIAVIESIVLVNNSYSQKKEERESILDASLLLPGIIIVI